MADSIQTKDRTPTPIDTAEDNDDTSPLRDIDFAPTAQDVRPSQYSTESTNNFLANLTIADSTLLQEAATGLGIPALTIVSDAETSDKPVEKANSISEILKEKTTALGTSIIQNENGEIRQIERTDGSTTRLTVGQDGSHQITERDKDGKEVNWTKDGSGRWTSNSGEQRQSMELLSNGNTQFKTADGMLHVITGKGIEFSGFAAENTGFDEQGRINQITYPNGKIRVFGYAESESQPNKVTSKEAGSNTWRSFIETGEDTWIQTDARGTILTQPWHGKVNLGERGTYATRANDDQTGSWTAMKIDGSNLVANANDEGNKPIPERRDKTDSKETTDKPTPTQEPKTPRDGLVEIAREKGMNVSRLNEFMDRFQQRCEEAKAAGLQSPSQEQITKTYSTLTEMLKGPAQPGGLSDRERAELVNTTMFNLANPRKIDQGLNLCNVTTSEEFTASRYPENYARLMKEVSLTGKFTTTSGKEITLPPGSIQKDEEQNRFTTENLGNNRWRNWSSKIFQETGINSVVPFLQPNANYPAWGKPHVEGKSDMSLPQIQAACEEINGKQMPYFPVGDAPTAEELIKLKEEGNFPAGVHTIHVRDQQGVVSGLHVQTIQDVRVRGGQFQVLLDNQRGGTNDQGWVTLPELHKIQQLDHLLTAKWYEIPAEYRGRDFDKLTPKTPVEVQPSQPPKENVKPEPPSVKPREDNPFETTIKPEHKPEAIEPAGPLESRRKLEQALFEGIDGLLESKRERKVREILDSLEKRCADDRRVGLTAPSEEQIARVYQSAFDTLKNNGVMPYEDRHKLVLEALRNISDPTGIDQGDHGTCGNTCAEKYIVVRNPDVYMDALSQVAATGTYTAPDGRILKLPHDDVRQGVLGNRTMTWQRGWKPDSESRHWDVYKEIGWHPLKSNEGKRNYASQIIQNLNIADALESHRLGQQQYPTPVDALNFLHVEDFTKRLTGKPITTINQRVPSEGNIQQPLTDKLALQLKADGRLPAMVWRAYHWQTIHDVRTTPGRDAYGQPANVVQVYSDNQWGNNRDRGWVTVPQLHQELAENP